MPGILKPNEKLMDGREMLIYQDQGKKSVSQNDKVRMTAPMPLKPTYQTHKVTRRTQSPTCHPPKRLPWESVPKQLTVRQVHEHGGTPKETGQDLTDQTTTTPSQPTINQSTQGRLACAYTPLISVKSKINSESMLHLATFNIVSFLIKPGNNDSFHCRLICC